MNARRLKRFSQVGISLLSAIVVMGCPSQSSVSQSSAGSESYSDLPLATPIAATAATAAEPAVTDSEPAASTEVSYAVCAEAADWQRPNEADQTKQVGSDPRYQGLEEEPLKSVSDSFWQHQAVSFTTYGLSARMEPVTFSGLWTVEEELWNCYEPEATEQINAGETAETWLMGHRITGLQWQSDRYVMTVEPTPAGVQIIQFDRVDNESELALSIVTADGQPVEVLSGDWE
ncbi:hypothetical protein IQ241_08205 [Romeria aff. gracilis LEGE 07310]|uniref:Uncharacterized protein n=1 Tax=Vasconcelosia minhoensis LEGE 07310 TaxID=915328 RepID=A0A8J7AWP4_9CYAN|nr:hypothetical protein [Romeria gracilis]MBE9077277.1 hypothetical protein [Romeria aff. gracilis LEGE 07310]